MVIGKEGFELGHLTPNSHFSTLQELQGKRGLNASIANQGTYYEVKAAHFPFLEQKNKLGLRGRWKQG